jgi:hypothetical protein
MERTRAWRRHKSECHFLRNIKRKARSSYYRFTIKYTGDYFFRLYNPLWIDKIGSDDIMIYKSIRTSKWESRHKVKWGKKGKKNFDWSSDPNTRPKDKEKFRKELLENGY